MPRETLFVVLAPATYGAGAAALVNDLVSIVDREGGVPAQVFEYPADSEIEAHVRDLLGDDPDQEPQPRWPRWKRAFDVLGALLIGVVTLPLWVTLALHIRVSSRGPVLFRQERLGYGGTAFQLLKFRTMSQDTDPRIHRSHSLGFISDGSVSMRKVDSKQNLIPLGRAIRLAGLDEIPQLINVLRGEMSIVGPRPCLPYEAEQYRSWHRRRFGGLPGITGLWQVSGKNALTFPEMVRLDLRYLRSQSLFRELAIVLRTPFALVASFLKGKG